jgi:hypothetical protein
MYAYCDQCRRVYDFFRLHGTRPWKPLCPECDRPLRTPPKHLLQLIRKRLEERRDRAPDP